MSVLHKVWVISVWTTQSNPSRRQEVNMLCRLRPTAQYASSARPIRSAVTIGKRPQTSHLAATESSKHELISSDARNTVPLVTLVGLASLAVLLVEPNAASASIQPSYDVAEGEEFFGNVARYGRYFVTVMVRVGTMQSCYPPCRQLSFKHE